MYFLKFSVLDFNFNPIDNANLKEILFNRHDFKNSQ
jgi:hypothetical protein